MAVKARASITLTSVVDVSAVYRYYLLQSATLAPPAVPETDPPGGSWTLAEPGYTSGSTNSLYTVDLTKFSDGSFLYSTVCLSSSYEAAKAAWNKASAAQTAAETALSQSSELIVGTQTAATNAWKGVSRTISALTDGVQITYWLPFAGTSSSATLNLTLSGGGTTGAKAVYISGATRCTTHIPEGNAVQMTYRVGVKIGSSTYTGWWISRARDSNDNTYDRTRWQNAIRAAEAVVTKSVIVGADDGYRTAGPGVSFDVGYPVLYTTGAIAAGSTATTGYLNYPSVALTNTEAGYSGTANHLVYLVGTLTDKTFTIDDEVFTTTEPTEADKRVYLPVGVAYSATNCYFQSSRELYAFRNGAFGPITAAAMSAAESALAGLETVKDRVGVTERSLGELTHKMESDYIARSEFGTYTEQIRTQIEASARSIVESYHYAELIEAAERAASGAGAELRRYMTSIDGQIRRGYLTVDGETVLGIAISQQLQFTGSEPITQDGETYYELSSGQTLGLYTATGWQFWARGQKIGWFSSNDGMLHVSQIVVEDRLQLGADWLITTSGGFGLRYTGG